MKQLHYHGAGYRLAYLEPEVAVLKNYLSMRDEAKGREIAGYDLDAFADYLRDNDEDVLADTLYDAEGDADFEALETIDPAVFTDFLAYMAHQGVGGDADAPSWFFLSYEEMLKNQWLIHFTDPSNLNAIEKNGFQKGQADYTRLGLTSYQRHGGPGYNFAYTLGEYWRHRPGYGDAGHWKYGDACVLFRASGIVAYHNGDDEYQTIFWGPSARNIVGLQQDDGAWILDPCGFTNAKLPRFDTLRDATAWVEANYNQYKRVLSCR